MGHRFLSRIFVALWAGSTTLEQVNMSIRQWLEQLGLDTYTSAFEENEITVEDLGELTSDDLKDELGVTKLIHRKKILAAIGSQAERPAAAATTAGVLYPEGLTPDDMPTYLAHPWRALCVEDHPRVKLHWLTDTAELAVRWAVALALAEVLHANDTVLPPALARDLRDNIQRPTLGRWLGMLRALTDAAPKNPSVAPGVFALYKATFEPRFKTINQGGTVQDSLLVMRNQIAHGGGMSRAHAQELLDIFFPQIQALLSEVLDVTRGTSVVSINKDRTLSLQGLSPETVEPPASVGNATSGTWLVGPKDALHMLPLVIYGPVKHIDSAGQTKDKPNSDSPQFFARADSDKLSYTPLGRDEAHSEIIEVELFRTIFQMDAARAARTDAALSLPWDEDIQQARRVAPDLVGRDVEIKHIKAWMKSRDPYDSAQPRVGWFWGGPGFGKSIIMDKLAADYSAGTHRGFFYHRFKTTGRHSKRDALRLLQAALYAWEPLKAITQAPDFLADGEALIDDLEGRLKAISTLEAHHPRAPRPAFWILLDGFNDIMANHPDMVDLVRKFAVDGTVWLVAGRPEHGLNEAFEGPSAEHIFEEGLGAMSPEDIRAMLLEGLGNARYALLRRDSDSGDGVQNQFIERVIQNARGLPLYVHLLLDDLRSGALTVQDDERLPDGLTAYYDALMDRVGLSSVRRDLPLIVCALAVASEPLDASALALLAAPELEDYEDYMGRVQAALRVGQALLRRATTPEGTQGYALYHQSFKEYITGTQDSPAAPALSDTLKEAQRKLYRLADAWDRLPTGNLTGHLFRWGTSYALRWQQRGGLEAACTRLTTFAYLQARTRALPAQAVIDLTQEYDEVLKEGAPETLGLWEAFFRERTHIIGRSNASWPAHKVLLQLAAEHADESPITQAVDSWLARGACDWMWARKVRRPQRIKPNLCLRVFEGHDDRVEGALRLDDDRMLSWSKDSTLGIWRVQTGEEIERLTGHTDAIDGVLQITDDVAVSWSRDHTIRGWDTALGEPLYCIEEHTKPIVHVARMGRDQLVSWSEDKSIGIWDAHSGERLDTLEGHTAKLNGGAVYGDVIMSWSKDRSIRLWNPNLAECTDVFFDKVEGHTKEVLGALLLEDQRVLGWDSAGDLVVWDPMTHEPQMKLSGHDAGVQGALIVDSTRVLSWDKAGLVILWSIETGECLAKMSGHSELIEGAMLLDATRALTWSKDATLRVWSLDEGTCLHHLEGHASWVRDVRRLEDGRVLSASGGGDMRLWDVDAGECVGQFEGHTAGVKGAHVLDEETVISWSWDKTLRIWTLDPDILAKSVIATLGHNGWITTTRPFGEGHVMSFGADPSVLVWSPETSLPVARFGPHPMGVHDVLMLEDDTMLTLGADFTMRRWSCETQALLGTFEGHTKKIYGALVTPQQEIISWSSDASIRVWNAQTAEQVHVFNDHKKLVQGAMMWDDHTLVSWSSDASIRAHHVVDRASLGIVGTHKKLIKGARRVRACEGIEQDLLLTWSSDKTLKLWDVLGQECVATLEGHDSIVEDARVFNARALSFGKDGEVIVWDLITHQLLHKLEGDEGRSQGVIDGDRVVTWTSKSKRFSVWDVTTGGLIERIEQDTAQHAALWRAKMGRWSTPNLTPSLRFHGGEGGVTLWRDAADGSSDCVVAWRESGLWETDGVSKQALTMHAGNMVEHLHVFEGTRRLMDVE